MGAGDSKLRLKKDVFYLFERDSIPPDDEFYWNKFLKLPETALDIFELLTASDIVNTKSLHVENLKTLVVVVSNRLVALADQSESFSDPKLTPAKEVLNCLRVLTRVLPFIYEEGGILEDDLLWNDSQHPRGAQLVNTALRLLFTRGFTVTGAATETGVSTMIWEKGIGGNGIEAMETTNEIFQNRVEVLRFLITLISDSIYYSYSEVVNHASRYTYILVSQPNKQLSMALLCSLLNVVLKYSSTNSYSFSFSANLQSQMVAYSLQLLLAMVIYPVTSTKEYPKTKNQFRHLLSKLHLPQDLELLGTSLTKMIAAQFSSSTALLTGYLQNSRLGEWTTEFVMLYWDLFRCNKKFKAYIISQPRQHQDLLVLLLRIVDERQRDHKHVNLVRTCAYFLLDITSDHSVMEVLASKPDAANPYSTYRSPYQPNSFNGSITDYLVIEICQSIQKCSKGDVLACCLADSLYNASLYISNMSYESSSTLVNLAISMSAQQVVKANAYQLRAVLVGISVMLSPEKFHSNYMLVFTLLRNYNAIVNIANVCRAVLNIDCDENAKLKGKGKAQSSKDDRETNELDPTLTNLFEGIIISCDNLTDALNELEDKGANKTGDARELMSFISNSSNNLNYSKLLFENIEPEPFEWNTESLGWYESVLWGDIFQQDRVVPNDSIVPGPNAFIPSNLEKSVCGLGIWNSTNIKLFKVQEVAPQTPSLLRPRGAVDAVAQSMIQKLENFRAHRT